jgi:hypothetical protein
MKSKFFTVDYGRRWGRRLGLAVTKGNEKCTTRGHQGGPIHVFILKEKPLILEITISIKGDILYS